MTKSLTAQEDQTVVHDIQPFSSPITMNMERTFQDEGNGEQYNSQAQGAAIELVSTFGIGRRARQCRQDKHQWCPTCGQRLKEEGEKDT
jgi:hypothetical protein